MDHSILLNTWNLSNVTLRNHDDFFGINLGDTSIALTVLYVPIFLLGFVGNSLVILLILTNRPLRNSTNGYLCNIALTDLSDSVVYLVSLVCVPMAVGQALYRVWIYGEFMCKATAYLQGVTVAASIFTISTLSVDRFLAIRYPIIFRRVSNTKVAIRFIAIIWFVSMIIMSPLLAVKKVDSVYLFEKPVHFCHELWPGVTDRQTYDICLLVFVYVIPGIVIFCAYSLIGNKLWTEDKNLQRIESETSKGIGKHVMTGRKRVAKMLIALAVLFAVCWLPYHIVSLYLDFTTVNANSFLVVLPFTILLGHSNSAFNPILYFYSSKNFRKYLYRALRCKSKWNKRSLAVRYTPAHGTKQQDTTVRPRIRISSTGSFKSSGTGSFRFSRSSNNSLKSSSRSREGSYKGDRSCDKDSVERNGLVVMHENVGKRLLKSKKEIMDTMLSIPSTINEESSRLGSLSPVNVVTSWMPYIVEAPEEIVNVSSWMPDIVEAPEKIVDVSSCIPDIEETPEEIHFYFSVSKSDLSLKFIDDEELDE